MNKKGDTTIIENTIFIVLNVVFFVIMFIFVYNSGNNLIVKEQTYAKEIALIIDSCKPGMSVLINIDELEKIAKDNKYPIEKIIRLDKKNSKVIVSLKDNSAFDFQYYSSNVDVKLNNQWLDIEVGKK